MRRAYATIQHLLPKATPVLLCVAGYIDLDTLSPLTVLAAAATPGWLIKQCINWSQLRTAAARLVAFDREKNASGSGGPHSASSQLQDLGNLKTQ